MQLVSLAASLVLSAVVASPSLAWAEDPAVATASYEATWVALTAPMPLSRGRDVIRLDGRLASALQLVATKGSSHVERVIVRFTDGSAQTIELGVVLDAVTPRVELAVGDAPTPIDRLIVIGASSRRSAVQLFGR